MSCRTSYNEFKETLRSFKNTHHSVSVCLCVCMEKKSLSVWRSTFIYIICILLCGRFSKPRSSSGRLLKTLIVCVRVGILPTQTAMVGLADGWLVGWSGSGKCRAVDGIVTG